MSVHRHENNSLSPLGTMRMNSAGYQFDIDGDAFFFDEEHILGLLTILCDAFVSCTGVMYGACAFVNVDHVHCSLCVVSR